MDMSEPCDLMRVMTRTACVIRLHRTGALLDIELAEPLSLARAAMTSPLMPAPATVVLGPYEGGKYLACQLNVEFAAPRFPPPIQFSRRQKEGLIGTGAGGGEAGRDRDGLRHRFPAREARDPGDAGAGEGPHGEDVP